MYDEMKRKGYTEKIDELTALLVQKEEALTVSERHFASLQEAVRLQNEEKKVLVICIRYCSAYMLFQSTVLETQHWI